jgi:hypothetical protein
MTAPRSKSELLSETTKTHLIDCFVSERYKRREEITGKFLEKGNAVEEDSITLLSRVTKRFYKKNDQRLSNGFITGEPDLFDGESISNADETIDTKSSWSAHTFFRVQKDELNNNYFWQGMGYMALTGAKKHTVAYCLVNGTPQAIMDEKKRLAYRLNVIDTSTDEEYLAKAKQIEINHIFDLPLFMQQNEWFELDNNPNEWVYDIPKEERVFKLSFDRDEAAIESIYKKVQICRDWMATNLYKSFE